MSDSGYFRGAKFRAVDSDAAGDEKPLSSVLEASISNNHQHLHIHGGGAVTRAMGARESSNEYVTNYQSHVSIQWSSLFMQPFLMTRGLKRIIVDWYGTNEWEDEILGVDMRLELRGFAYSDIVTWENTDYPANGHQQIVLELITPFDSEYETELVLWCKGQVDQNIEIGEYLDRQSYSNKGNGYFVVPGPPYTLTNLPNRAIKVIGTGVGFSFTQPLYYLEPLYRSNTGLDPEGNVTETVIYNEQVDYSRIVVGEIKIGALTSRSLIIRQEFE